MARGKHAAEAAKRRHAEAEARIAELERELAETRALARRQEIEYEERLTSQGYDISRRTAERVQELMNQRVEELADGVGNAAWRAQRLAMTEHLTWLFFKGYVTWDRFDGDGEVLKFLATHGDLKAWFVLTGKYGHRHNYKDRREDARRDPITQMLGVIRDIDRAKNGDRGVKTSREELDAVVEYARSAFVNVELQEMLTAEGWQVVEPSADEIAMHREIAETLPHFRDAFAQ